ncbi:MAG TPA: flagellar hook capping FlgD N-terminal domain-containing protein, partial [Planctomycetota bacterium]|nr:flagellar hook capping FlgD N-terminal domain-containing protein [Planctomycetota bacterium]
MAISSIGAAGAATAVDQQKVFREADFMKIMLSELSQQDPFEPQETSKIVEGMQKLQDLANSRFEKYRDDQRWAQDLVGKTVTAQQMILTDAEAEELVERGLAPGRGYASVDGKVDAF